MFELNPALMTFNGQLFKPVELDGEPWIRADELGTAIGLGQPEIGVIGLCRNNPDHFSDHLPTLTRLARVETSEGTRMMRVFSLLGAYVLCTFVDNSRAHSVRRWLLEKLVDVQMSAKREAPPWEPGAGQHARRRPDLWATRPRG